MNKLLSATLVALVATASFAATIEGASARSYHRTSWAQGSHGRGYVKNVDRSCGGGSCTGHRSVETNGGYGYTADRNRSCANGTCTGSTTVTGNNGRTWTHNGSVSNTGNGASWYSNTTGPDGGSISRSGSVTRPQD